jgi:hypothetical protein
MRIDVHAHYWTDDYLDLLVDLGKTDTGTQRGSSSHQPTASSPSKASRPGGRPDAASRRRSRWFPGPGAMRRAQPPRGTEDPRQHPPFPPAASIRSLIVTRPACQPRSGNWTP